MAFQYIEGIRSLAGFNKWVREDEHGEYIIDEHMKKEYVFNLHERERERLAKERAARKD